MASNPLNTCASSNSNTPRAVILDGALLAGNFPIGKTRLVQAWIEIHRDALMADWELAVNGQPPFPIEPLR